MKVEELQKQCNLDLAAGEKGLDREVTGGYCGDLCLHYRRDNPVFPFRRCLMARNPGV